MAKGPIVIRTATANDKASYDRLYLAPKVSLQVTNAGLAQALAAECGSVWWVGQLSGD